jgi:Haem-NO-binding
MKGVVFTEFLNFADEKFGATQVETAILAAQLPSGGAYTTVGTYPTGELVSILGQLSERTRLTLPELLTGFGKHLFAALATRYAPIVAHYGDSLSLLEAIQSVIHAEVLKLYQDAELPTFTHERRGPDELILIYQSERGLGLLVDGLLEGCFAHFGEAYTQQREDLSQGENRRVKFHLRRIPASP